MDRVRAALPDELIPLATLWHDALQDSYADIAPELVRRGTVDGLAERLRPLLADLLVIGPPGAPQGFCALKGDELYQIFLAAPARGTGRAQALMARAEEVFRARGVERAWLACVVGNHRAARFYEKLGWTRTGTQAYRVDTLESPLDITVWRFEKTLVGEDD